MRSASLRWDRPSHATVLLGLGAAAFVLATSACSGREAPRSAVGQDVRMTTVVMPVEGMSCSACVARVKKALTSIDGVSDVQVNLIERNARIRFAPDKTSSDRLVAAVSALGYRAGPAMGEPASPAAKPNRPLQGSEAR